MLDLSVYRELQCRAYSADVLYNAQMGPIGFNEKVVRFFNDFKSVEVTDATLFTAMLSAGVTKCNELVTVALQSESPAKTYDELLYAHLNRTSAAERAFNTAHIKFILDGVYDAVNKKFFTGKDNGDLYTQRNQPGWLELMTSEAKDSQLAMVLSDVPQDSRITVVRNARTYPGYESSCYGLFLLESYVRANRDTVVFLTDDTCHKLWRETHRQFSNSSSKEPLTFNEYTEMFGFEEYFSLNLWQVASGNV